MNIISTFIVWTWLLCIGLVAPTTLPAGGAQESIIQHRKNNIGSPIIALKDFNLLTSASNNSSTLFTEPSLLNTNVPNINLVFSFIAFFVIYR